MFSDDIQAFVVNNIQSIAQIEALVLLRSDPARAWDAGSLAGRLYIPVEESVRLLKYMTGLSILIEDAGAYRYSCASADLDDIVHRLVELYKTHLIPITNIIHSRGSLRIQEFADAFRLRKDK